MTLLQIVEWELYLWRPAATDSRLPWQKPLAVDQLTPGRVIRSFGENLERVGTPVSPVLPRGKSPSWPAGRHRTGQRPIVWNRKSEKRRWKCQRTNEPLKSINSSQFDVRSASEELYPNSSKDTKLFY
jgi:hypothetical protein